MNIEKTGKDFIGMGNNPNPNVPDIPLGLGMALFQEAEARKNFEALSDSQKTKVINYVQSGNATGGDAKDKIMGAVEKLKNNSFDFYG